VLGIEGGSSTRHSLLVHLLETYKHVYEVNPLYTKQRRAYGTKSVKSDPVDAKLIAEVLTRKLSELPKITRQELTANRLSLKKIVWFYEEATVLGTRLKNQLHQLNREKALSLSQEEKRVLQTIITSKLHELETLKKRKEKLKTGMDALLKVCGKNLTTFPGISTISAAKIVASTNGVERFPTVDKFLRYAGIAPREKSSGKRSQGVKFITH